MRGSRFGSARSARHRRTDETGPVPDQRSAEARNSIRLKSPDDIARMRAAGRVVHKVLDHCGKLCRPGVTTRQIDDEAQRLIAAEGARGLFKNYPTYKPGEGFPSNLCISVNEQVVHGIAGDRKIQDEDIVGIDCGVQLNGWCADAATTVSAIIAAGVLPAALELMDRRVVEAVEPFVHAGYPLDAAAVLIVELDGLPGGVDHEVGLVTRIGSQGGARTVRLAADDAERDRIWKGRKSAFGAIANIRPDYYLHDTVIPRTKLAGVLDEVYAIAERHDLLVMNVFHAGDGNLHPLLLFDSREPGVMERVLAAGEEIVRASLAAGGVLSGEHGIGLEKRRFMSLQFSPEDLAAQDALRRAFDPDGIANPLKVLPTGASCGDVNALDIVPDGVWV